MSSVLTPSSFLAPLAGEDELVHRPAVEGDRQVLAGPALAHPREQVVGVEHGGLGGLGEPVAAEAEDVGVGADEDAEVALEAAQPADRLGLARRRGSKRARVAVGALAPLDPRHRQVGLDPVGDGDRPGPRTAAPCGWLNDLWRLTWTMSKPMSPGREWPMIAFRLAPS